MVFISEPMLYALVSTLENYRNLAQLKRPGILFLNPHHSDKVHLRQALMLNYALTHVPCRNISAYEIFFSSSMIYQQAAGYLDGGPGSLKNRIFAKNSGPQAKRLFALCYGTLQYKTVLQAVITSAHLLKYEKSLTLPVALVMVHDLLFSKGGKLACGKCKEKDAVMRHKTRLNAEFVKYKVKHGLTQDAADETPVRWVRCNPVKAKPEDLENAFAAAGLTRVETFQVHQNAWYKDDFVSGLYGLHPSYPVSKMPLYRSGQLIIQDRASCFPVTILGPDSSSEYIDACAAPGNKTTQLAGFAKKVTAFERDPKRGAILEKMIATAGLSDRITVQLQDFTKSQPSEFPKVHGLVVDPSCSGSGIFGRAGLQNEEETPNTQRLDKLAEFQYIIVSHALKFSAKTVVYSTCSIHATENERVVRRLLETPGIAKEWRLRSRDSVLPGWPRRGLVQEFEGMKNAAELADSCVRVNPIEDGGIGFFAACFERIG